MYICCWKDTFIEVLTKEVSLSSGSISSTLHHSNSSPSVDPGDVSNSIKNASGFNIFLQGSLQHENIFMVVAKTVPEIPVVASLFEHKMASDTIVRTVRMNSDHLHDILSSGPASEQGGNSPRDLSFPKLATILASVPADHSVVFLVVFSSKTATQGEEGLTAPTSCQDQRLKDVCVALALLTDGLIFLCSF
jgi:hypothetical protein